MGTTIKSYTNANNASRFEKAVGETLKLQAAGFASVGIPTSHASTPYDFEITQPEHPNCSIEVKFYRLGKSTTSYIDRAAFNLRNTIPSNNAAILITSTNLSPEFRRTIERYGVVIVCGADLLVWAQADSSLSAEMSKLTSIDPEAAEIDFSFSTLQEALDKAYGTIGIYVETTGSGPESLKNNQAQIESDGQRYKRSLKELRPGGESGRATSYENLMFDVVQYLFSDYLGQWTQQTRSADGLNRLDILCKVENESGFWSFIARDLQSRFVVFECKNYSGEIDQSQILTTEKYLYKKAFRSFAVVLTRQGQKESARKMAKGALREAGKLIIVLDDNDVLEMIDAKMNNDDPSELLANHVDNFLIGLSR